MNSFAHFLLEDIRHTPPGEKEWWGHVLSDLRKGDESSLLVYADWLLDQTDDYDSALRGNKFLNMVHDSDAYSEERQRGFGNSSTHLGHEFLHKGPATWLQVATAFADYPGPWEHAGCYPYDANTLGQTGGTIPVFGACRPGYRGKRGFTEDVIQVWLQDRGEMPEWVVKWLHVLSSSQ